MAPTEASILSYFLITPAPLSAAITLQQFTNLFPRSLQSSAQIVALYRELQHQRAIDIDDVKKNIEAEVQRGVRQRRQVAIARRKSFTQSLGSLDQRDIVIESELNGLHGQSNMSQPHTLETILPAMDDAILNLRVEVKDLEREVQQTLDMLQSKIGDLSDLRYGKFSTLPGSNEDPASQAVEGLQHVQRILS